MHFYRVVFITKIFVILSNKFQMVLYVVYSITALTVRTIRDTLPLLASVLVDRIFFIERARK